MSDTFLETICSKATEQVPGSLDMATCRELLLRLCSQLSSDGESSELFRKKGQRIIGQETLVQRTIMSLLMNEHLLLEGLPGVAKTQTVKFLAQDTGMINVRVQFFPDMLPSDLVGKTTFDVRALRAATAGDASDGESGPAVEHWLNGPLFCNLLVADEINRAPSKVQAALLEAMGERQITPLGQAAHVIRSDREWEMWLRHIRMLELSGVITGDIWGSFKTTLGTRGVSALDHKALTPAVTALNSQTLERFGSEFPFGKSFGWADPMPLFGASPIDLSSSGDAQLTVFATQNPIEQAGTYPMSEAQVDRFNLKHVVHYPDYDSLFKIGGMINRRQRLPDPDKAFNIPAEQERTGEERARRDLALRASLYFFRRARELVFGSPGKLDDSPLGNLLDNEALDPMSPAGKILRIVFYTHFKMPRTTRASEAANLLTDTEQQDHMRFLYRTPVVRGDLAMLAGSDVFEYVNSGASPRGFMGLIRAALTHAFLNGTAPGVQVCDTDIRAMAEDVLAHRIRLNSQAKVRDLTPGKLLDVVMDTVFGGGPSR